jgi:hypothetical protein
MKIRLITLLCLAASSLTAQQEQTFDLASYTIPFGWRNVNTASNVIAYAITNNPKGTYAQLAIYASTTSKGSLQADFNSEWQELVVKTYNPKTAPQLTPSETRDGWSAQAGVAPFEFNGAQAAAMLVTSSGYGRCMSIVVLTNTSDYEKEIQKFLEGVDLSKPVRSDNTTVQSSGKTSVQAATEGFQFSTTNFNDGWTSTAHEDWVQVAKGNIRVLIHYPNKKADSYNSVLLDGLQNAWNVLVAPRYTSATNLEFKPINGWQPIEFAEADAVDAAGKKVHVVLFKVNYSGGGGRYLEFITPDKRSFEQEFGAYHDSSTGWEKMENMASYNKFAVATADLTGKWTSDFGGALQYVNAYTGSSAGIATHSSNEHFEFGPGNIYKWNLSVASGFVGNIKFQGAKSNGTFSMPDNWQVSFSDIEGKPKTYNVFFSCVKGARILWLDGKGYGRMN